MEKDMELSDSFNFVQFFIGHDLVNINEITWDNKDRHPISTAAMCYLKGNYHLGEFLYSQPTYKDNEQKVKDESDLVILKVLSDKKPKLEEFIKNPKFTCNLSRYIYLMQLLVINIKKNSEQIEIKDLDTFDELLISKMSEEDKEMLEISRLRYNKNNEKDSYLSILKGNSLSNLERKKLK